jgi:hypothetical protein
MNENLNKRKKCTRFGKTPKKIPGELFEGTGKLIQKFTGECTQDKQTILNKNKVKELTVISTLTMKISNQDRGVVKIDRQIKAQRQKRTYVAI